MISICTFCRVPFHWDYRKNRTQRYCSLSCCGGHKAEQRRSVPSNITKPDGLLFSAEDHDLYLIKWHRCEAGYFVRSEYVKAKKSQERMAAHQMVFFRMHGFLPKKSERREIDHSNRNKADNRRDNLKLATCQQNIANTDRVEHATRVTWHKAAGKWQGMYEWLGRSYYVGLFEDRNTAETKTAAHRRATLSALELATTP